MNSWKKQNQWTVFLLNQTTHCLYATHQDQLLQEGYDHQTDMFIDTATHTKVCTVHYKVPMILQAHVYRTGGVCVGTKFFTRKLISGSEVWFPGANLGWIIGINVSISGTLLLGKTTILLEVHCTIFHNMYT